MSSERIKGEVVFVCDDCDDILETGTYEFEMAHTIRREAGWSARQDRAGGPWRRRCDDCDSVTSAFHPVV